MPNDKIIKFNNKFYTRVENDIIEVPNIKDSSQVTSLKGVYNIQFTFQKRNSAKSISLNVINNLEQTYNNVLMYVYYIESAVINTEASWENDSSSSTATVSFMTTRPSSTPDEIFKIQVPPSVHSEQIYNISQIPQAFILSSTSPVTLSLVPNLIAQSNVNVFTNSSTLNCYGNIIYKYYIFQYLA